MAGVAKATNREQPSPQPVEAPVAVVPPPVTINPAAGPLQSATAKGMQSGAVQQTQQQSHCPGSGHPRDRRNCQ